MAPHLDRILNVNTAVIWVLTLMSKESTTWKIVFVVFLRKKALKGTELKQNVFRVLTSKADIFTC